MTIFTMLELKKEHLIKINNNLIYFIFSNLLINNKPLYQNQEYSNDIHNLRLLKVELI